MKLLTILMGVGLLAQDANWTTYHGNYSSTHHSTLTQITPANARNLELKWTFQAQSLEKFEATPLVVDGVMYLTEAPNTIIALDAATGRELRTQESGRHLSLLREDQPRTGAA
jgi:glucose dehydrogenase